MDSKFAKLVKVVRNKKGKGRIFTKDSTQTGIDNQLKELAALIKEFMFAELDKSGKHKIRRDKYGMYQDTEVTFNSDGVKISVPDYAQWVESGRRVGAKKVPIAALLKWLKRYRVISRDRKTGKFKKSSNSSLINAAFAIQKTIYKKGIKARPFLGATLDYAEGLIEAAIENIIAEDIISVIEFHLPTK